MDRAQLHLRLLLAMPERLQAEVIKHLHCKGADVFRASCCAEVGEILQRYSPIQVVLTVPELEDGCWRSILEELTQHRSDAEVVVCVEHASRELDNGMNP